MRLKYIAGFLVYLVLSIMIILPVQVAAFNATVSGSTGAKDSRSELDVTNVKVYAESPVSIQATDGQSYSMTCTNVGNYECSYSFPENTLSPGAHQLILHQENGTPSTLNKVFYVDNLAPEIISSSVSVVSINSNTTALIGNKLNVSMKLIDPPLTSSAESCAGIKSISLTTETQSLLEKTIEPTCDYDLSEILSINNVEGNITIFATITDAVGQTTTEEIQTLDVDFKAPSIADDFTLLLGEEEITSMADQPQMVPFVTVRFFITENNLTSVIVDASSMTADPAVFPTYKNLQASCELQGGQNLCYVDNIQLNPNSGVITLGVTATDEDLNIAMKNITKTYEIVNKKGEITYFNPLQEHCDDQICYIKKGANKFQITILHDLGIIPSLITLATGDLSPVPKIKAMSCNETSIGQHDCFAVIPVTINQTDVGKKIVLTTPSTDITGNMLKGLLEYTVILDNDIPKATSQPLISDLCPTAGMTATINLTAYESTSSKLFFTAITNTTTGGYNFSSECSDKGAGNFYCEVLLQQFVSYPETENITLVLEDLAGNKQQIPFELRVCQAESDVAPENIRSIVASTNQKINKRVASITATNVFLALTFNIQSSAASRTEILAVESDGCLNTEYLGGKPYFINENTFVRTQDSSSNRGELLFVVPVGNQVIGEDAVTIDCNLSIYQRIGETRYLLPEKQQLKIDVGTYNNPLGTVSDNTQKQLNQIIDDITGLQEDIDSRMKLHKNLEWICKLANTLGQVSQAISIVESEGYVLALIAEIWGSGTAVWTPVCKAVSAVRNPIKKIWPDKDAGTVNILSKFVKAGCAIYNCGLCTVDGLMMTVNLGMSTAQLAKSQSAKAEIVKSDLNDQVKDVDSQLQQEQGKLDTLKANLQAEVTPQDGDLNLEYLNTSEGARTTSDISTTEKTITTLQNDKVDLTTTLSQDNKQLAQIYNQPILDQFSLALQEKDSTSSTWIIDPYKNKAYAGICLCNPGMIYALNKEKQLKCREYKCIEGAAEQGLPITECQQDYKVASCLYVEGAMTKRTFLGEVWQGIKNALLSDPVKTVRMGVCIDEYLPIDTGLQKQAGNCDTLLIGWREVFCGLTGAYLHLRDIKSLFTNPFENAPLTPDGENFCEGIEGVQT